MATSYFKLTYTNYSPGRFQLRLLQDGSLVLNAVSLPAYFPYNPYQIIGVANSPDNRSSLVFNESGHLYVESSNGSTVDLSPQDILPIADFYHRATLDVHGAFFLFAHPRPSRGGSGDWSTQKSFPDDVCDITGDLGGGACGYNSYCGVANGMPIFVIYNSASQCWKKRLPVSNGKALFKVRRPTSPNATSSTTKKKDQTTAILVGSLGGSVFINFLLLAATCLSAFSAYQKRPKSNTQGSSISETNLRSFTYKELEEAANGFKEELGRGAFGIVYKGIFPIGSGNLVAVKRLDKVVQEGEKEFKTEVIVIGQTHHKNLVRLFGFCEEGPHRILVYEFMSNGWQAFSLDSQGLIGTKEPRLQLGSQGGLHIYTKNAAPILELNL
ncbi:G-type lectin S-receptor-like serine/threonine-protein kinase LECRK3 [Macadamia integrifolia]|uniref:G-type lectin S-receptor-like serine/threonine-protein kinase LECRK3 n=1 Tax=Macadamia integrifolia TaxID=60698 RepID=UPI001C532756|nr:G-type lectin S-receptor-like serine/threonine-protein kinase LECRK3 [Macadamia integrifolia]